MEASHFINMIIIFPLNLLFFVSGMFLNSLVIISFWRTAQLRQVVLFHGFVLLRLVAVLTDIPLSALIAMLWLTGELDGSIRLMGVLTKLSGIFFGVSLHALLVMNFDRYLATSYPLYHRTSMTKRKHLILFAMLTTICKLPLTVHSKQRFKKL